MTPDRRAHAWAIADEPRGYRRHEERRGRRFAYEALDPRRTALVVVDVVAFFARESAVAPAVAGFLAA